MTEYASNKTPFSLTEVDIDSPGGVPAKDVGYHDLNGLERMMKNLASDTGAESTNANGKPVRNIRASLFGATETLGAVMQTDHVVEGFDIEDYGSNALFASPASAARKSSSPKHLRKTSLLTSKNLTLNEMLALAHTFTLDPADRIPGGIKQFSAQESKKYFGAEARMNFAQHSKRLHNQRNILQSNPTSALPPLALEIMNIFQPPEGEDGELDPTQNVNQTPFAAQRNGVAFSLNTKVVIRTQTLAAEGLYSEMKLLPKPLHLADLPQLPDEEEMVEPVEASITATANKDDEDNEHSHKPDTQPDATPQKAESGSETLQRESSGSSLMSSLRLDPQLASVDEPSQRSHNSSQQHHDGLNSSGRGQNGGRGTTNALASPKTPKGPRKKGGVNMMQAATKAKSLLHKISSPQSQSASKPRQLPPLSPHAAKMSVEDDSFTAELLGNVPTTSGHNHHKPLPAGAAGFSAVKAVNAFNHLNGNSKTMSNPLGGSGMTKEQALVEPPALKNVHHQLMQQTSKERSKDRHHARSGNHSGTDSGVNSRDHTPRHPQTTSSHAALESLAIPAPPVSSTSPMLSVRNKTQQLQRKSQILSPNGLKFLQQLKPIEGAGKVDPIAAALQQQQQHRREQESYERDVNLQELGDLYKEHVHPSPKKELDGMNGKNARSTSILANKGKPGDILRRSSMGASTAFLAAQAAAVAAASEKLKQQAALHATPLSKDGPVLELVCVDYRDERNKQITSKLQKEHSLFRYVERQQMQRDFYDDKVVNNRGDIIAVIDEEEAEIEAEIGLLERERETLNVLMHPPPPTVQGGGTGRASTAAASVTSSGSSQKPARGEGNTSTILRNPQTAAKGGRSPATITGTGKSPLGSSQRQSRATDRQGVAEIASATYIAGASGSPQKAGRVNRMHVASETRRVWREAQEENNRIFMIKQAEEERKKEKERRLQLKKEREEERKRLGYRFKEEDPDEEDDEEEEREAARKLEEALRRVTTEGKEKKDSEHDVSLDLSLVTSKDTNGGKLSPRSLFIDNCLRANVNPRASLVLRKLYTQELQLAHLGMGDHLAILLADALVHLPYIEALNVRDNNLADPGLSALVKSIVAMQKLTTLDMSYNEIGPDAAQALYQYLSTPACPLEHLVLEKADVDDDECRDFVQALHHNLHLRELTLTDNKVGSSEALNTVMPDLVTGGEALAELLRSPNCPLTSLKLGWNLIRLGGAAELCQSLGMNQSLTYLDLSYNSLGVSGGIALGDALQDNSVLRQLYVANNALDSVSLMVIVAGILENKNLEFVCFDGNPIGEQGAMALMLLPTMVGSRVLVSAKNCNLNIQDPNNWFDTSALVRTYTLDLMNPFERSIGIILSYIIPSHQTYIMAHGEYFDPSAKAWIDLQLQEVIDKESYKTKDLDPEQAKIIEKLQAVQEATRDIQKAIALFNEVDEDGSGQLDESEFGNLLRMMGMDTSGGKVQEIMAEYDVDGGGVIEMNEFLLFLKSQQKKATKRLKELTEVAVLASLLENPQAQMNHTGMSPPPTAPRGSRPATNHTGSDANIPPTRRSYNTTPGSIIKRYLPPRSGQLKLTVVDGFTQKDTFRVISPGDRTNILKIAEQSGELMQMTTFGMKNYKVRLSEALSIVHRLLKENSNKVRVLASVLPQMATPADAKALVFEVLGYNLVEVQRLKREVGQAYRVIMGQPDGFYVLDLSNAMDRFCVNRLLEISMTTAHFRAHKRSYLGYGRLGDTSQKGNFTCFRNEMYAKRPITLSVAFASPLPKAGRLEFDFVSQKRYKSDNFALSDVRFTNMLVKTYQLDTAERMEALNALQKTRLQCDKTLNGDARTIYETPKDRALEIGQLSSVFFDKLGDRVDQMDKYRARESVKVTWEYDPTVLQLTASTFSRVYKAPSLFHNANGKGLTPTASKLKAVSQKALTVGKTMMLRKTALMNRASISEKTATATADAKATEDASVGASSPRMGDNTGGDGSNTNTAGNNDADPMSRLTTASGLDGSWDGDDMPGDAGHNIPIQPYDQGDEDDNLRGPKDDEDSASDEDPEADQFRELQEAMDAVRELKNKQKDNPLTNGLPSLTVDTANNTAANSGRMTRASISVANNNGFAPPQLTRESTVARLNRTLQPESVDPSGDNDNASESTPMSNTSSRGRKPLSEVWNRYVCLMGSSNVPAPAKAAKTLELLVEAFESQFFYARHLEMLVVIFEEYGSLPMSDDFGTYRVELIVQLFGCVIDLHHFEIVMRRLTSLEAACVICRLGILNIFNPMKPEGSYELDLSQRDHRVVVKMLAQLAIVEPGDNLPFIQFRWERGMDPMPGFELTEPWMTEEGMPKKGVWNATYYAGEGKGKGGCKPSVKFRKALLNLVLIEEEEVISETDRDNEKECICVGPSFIQSSSKALWLNYLAFNEAYAKQDDPKQQGGKGGKDAKKKK